jgi:uncharacterized protein (TIGR02246 family)
MPTMKSRVAPRAMLAGLLAVMIATSGNGAGAPSRTGEAELRASLDRLALAWNTPDAAAWAGEYWPEGELVNILGTVLPGAESVRDRTAEILAGPFRGSHFEYVIRKLRFIGQDVAIVDTDITISSYRGVAAIPPTSPGVLLTRMKHVYERRHGSWHIVASQNTAVVPAAHP